MHIATAAVLLGFAGCLLAAGARGREIVAWLKQARINYLMACAHRIHRALYRSGYRISLASFGRGDRVEWVPLIRDSEIRFNERIRFPPEPPPEWDEAEMAAWADSNINEAGDPHGE